MATSNRSACDCHRLGFGPHIFRMDGDLLARGSPVSRRSGFSVHASWEPTRSLVWSAVVTARAHNLECCAWDGRHVFHLRGAGLARRLVSPLFVDYRYCGWVRL